MVLHCLLPSSHRPSHERTIPNTTMVQMSPSDQKVVKAKPGNTVCSDCPMKNPQWASVSFGNLFCLECSGVHRSLGVHISFVRSVAMDSWTDKQLELMKSGGNDELNKFLKKYGIDPHTDIKKKYESPAAQLYKEILKARAEGRPEPTKLPEVSVAKTPMRNGAGGDPSGMERMAGESDAMYVSRQTRLRDEARQRMAAKFGAGGSMKGVGSRPMAGIGSDPNYNPNGGAYSVDSVVSGFGTAFNSVGSLAMNATQSVSSIITDKSTQNSISNLSNQVQATGASFWGGLSTQVQAFQTMTQGDGNDGLEELHRQMQSRRPTGGTKYAGFGSDKFTGMPSATSAPTPQNKSFGMTNGAVTEAPGLPGEDPNGVGRLTGESDEQYVARQTRLRDEAKARMAAKFGEQKLSSAGGSVPQLQSKSAPPSGNGITAASFSSPSRSNFQATAVPTMVKDTPKKTLSSDDFFASFGS